MNTKFSEDVIPISDLKINPGRIRVVRVWRSERLLKLPHASLPQE